MNEFHYFKSVINDNVSLLAEGICFVVVKMGYQLQNILF